jgi:hypothetical protein
VKYTDGQTGRYDLIHHYAQGRVHDGVCHRVEAGEESFVAYQDFSVYLFRQKEENDEKDIL